MEILLFIVGLVLGFFLGFFIVIDKYKDIVTEMKLELVKIKADLENKPTQ